VSSPIHRSPAEESVGLYPGLVVHDGRKTGAITVGRSRLPLWAIGVDFPDWDDYAEPYELTRGEAVTFVHDLLELRGEFARLLLVLADAERCERTGAGRAWWLTKRHRKRVAAQLRRCLDTLEDE
jgi:hypothetical protein